MAGKIFLIVLLVLVIVLVVLYFLGKKAQKKQEAQQEQMEAAKQTVTMLIIDKGLVQTHERKSTFCKQIRTQKGHHSHQLRYDAFFFILYFFLSVHIH